MKLRDLSYVSSFLGSVILSVILFIYFLRELFFKEDSWIVDVYQNHFLATMGLPFAGISSFFVVSIFKNREEPIKFEALGIKFEGSSGQVVLWVFVFITEAICMKLLW